MGPNHFYSITPPLSVINFFGFFSKTIHVNIIDDEEYEKNKNFFIELGDPRLLEMSERKGVGGCLTSLE